MGPVRRMFGRMGRTGLIAAALSAILAGGALAAYQSGTYKGKLTDTNARVTIKVSHAKASAALSALPMVCGSEIRSALRFPTVALDSFGSYYAQTTHYKYHGHRLTLRIEGEFLGGSIENGLLFVIDPGSSRCAEHFSFTAKT